MSQETPKYGSSDSEPIEEEKKVKVPVIKPKRVKRKKKVEVEVEKKPEIKTVVPVKTVNEELESGIAIFNKSKFIAGKWWVLKEGKKIVAPKLIIDSLRNANLLK